MKFLLNNKRINYSSLCDYGFIKKGNLYIYSCKIMDNQFKLDVIIDESENLSTKLVDCSTGELYTLHLLEDADGAFVGQIKKEYETIMQSVSLNCFVSDIFKSKETKALLEYAKNKYNDDPEFLWQKFSDNAVLRRKSSKKWYAVILVLDRLKLGFEKPGRVEIVDLRINKSEITGLIDNKKYFPGYHMNKKSWYTICLDGSVPIEEIFDRLDKSYDLA